MKQLIALLVPLVIAGAPVPKSVLSGIPIHFEPNVGQSGPAVLYSARAGGLAVFLSRSETVIAARGQKPVRMKLLGGLVGVAFEPVDRLPGVSNYYHGNDPKKWRAGVPHYARVRAKRVYPGVDVVYYGSGRRIEYDFVVAPGIDPDVIRLAYDGVDNIRLDDNGGPAAQDLHGRALTAQAGGLAGRGGSAGGGGGELPDKERMGGIRTGEVRPVETSGD